MRVFRKRKKFGNFGGAPEDAEPMPDIVYQMAAEAAVKYVAARARSQSPYAGIDLAKQEAIFGSPYSQIHIVEENPFYEIPENESDEQVQASSPLKFIASALGFGRSRSRERYANRSRNNFVRAGSPVNFNQHPPGTPVKSRRRAASPELVQARAPSPLHFVQSERVPSPLHFTQQSYPTSPDVARRLHRAQLSQELQRIEREQRRQHEMMMMNSLPYIPQYQQVQQPYYPLINSNVNLQAYSMPQQPQMYSYY
jgi:hypothetical protein